MSNAFDAIKKLKTISVKESLTDLQREGKIDLIPNEKENTLTIKDNGLGMTSEEIQKYINQIAFSGAEEFVAKYKDKEDGEQIIGQFGLGFYSAFMVSTLVEINTKSYKEGSQAVKWTCDGSTSFSIVESDKEDVGTEIILHLSDDAKEYLAEERLKNLVERFSNFLPVDIQVNGKTANNQNPIWIQQPSELKEEDYKKFYNVLFPFKGDPLFWIHLNVDYPFNLKGILYFPKIAHELDGNKGQVKLFCQQVFVTDNAKEILPEFLTLLQGAIDCPELPLNVSRSFLQQDPYVQKISKHIVKKVADKLIELHKNEKEQFEKHWEDINPFIKYGMMNDDSFYKKVENIVLFPSSSGNSTSLKEYTERNKEKLENKVLYCEDKEKQASYVAMCKDQGLEVIFLKNVIDVHFFQFLESKNKDLKFVAIDTEVSDHLVDEDSESKTVDPVDNKTESDKLNDIFKDALNNDKLKIEVKHLKSEKISGMLIEAEHVKRLRSMSAMMQGQKMPSFDDYTLVVNSNHSLVKNILTLNQALDPEGKVKPLCQHVYDLASLSQKQLSGEELQSFIERSNELLSGYSQK